MYYSTTLGGVHGVVVTWIWKVVEAVSSPKARYQSMVKGM
jgi:hypothetical protein